jgi:GntP family gluconate:H+ symporter
MTHLESLVPGPFGIVAISVAIVVLAIGVFRLHPFYALALSAVAVGLLSAAKGTDPHRFVDAIETVTSEAGAVVGRLGFTIAMAAVIGLCMQESGAADKIIRRLIAAVGEERAAIALLVSAFILAAPVFFDTVMLLLLPLARALSLRTGKNYLLNALVICAGAAISNGTVPPAPGPLFAAESLRLELGVVIAAGLAFGIFPLVTALLAARWFNRRIEVPVRATPGSSLDSLAAVAACPESTLPPLWLSVCPVAVPMALIAGASFAGLLRGHLGAGSLQLLEFFGDKNVAIGIGGFLALATYARQRKVGWRAAAKVLGAPLEMAGVIILIIAAGGAYGAMIKNAGVGEAVRALANDHAINYVLLAWLVAAVIRAAQGSSTVATITSVSIMLSIAGTGGFGVHPLYILLAVGFGSKFLAWMNDSGFWIICRLGGLTQEETLKTWTPLVSIVSVAGLVEVLAAAHWFPNLPFR